MQANITHHTQGREAKYLQRDTTVQVLRPLEETSSVVGRNALPQDNKPILGRQDRTDMLYG